MAVAFDAFSAPASSSVSEDSFSWTHTPSGTPKGVLVAVFARSSSDWETGVSYGSATLSVVSGSSSHDTSGENGGVQLWFLGSGIPTGAQTVTVTRQNTTQELWAIAWTVTASGDVELNGLTLENQNQTLTEENIDDGSPGTNSVRFMGLYWGGNDILSASIGANSTHDTGFDGGQWTFQGCHETTAGQGARPVGYDTGATSDDVGAAYVAIREAATSINLTPTPATIPLVAAAITLAFGPLTLTPDAVATQLLAPSATVSQALTLTPDPAPIPLVVPSATLLAGDLVLTPDAVAIPLAVPAATLDPGSLALSPDAASIPLAVPSVTVSLSGIDLTPTPVALPLIAPSVTLAQALTLTPDAASVPLVPPSVTLSQALTLTPDAAAIPLAVPSITLATALTLTPDAAAIPLAVPSVTLIAPLTLTPAAVALPLVPPSVTLSLVAPAALQFRVLPPPPPVFWREAELHRRQIVDYERAVDEWLRLPFQPAHFASADRPDAAEYPGCVLFNETTKTLQYSDGTSWIDL